MGFVMITLLFGACGIWFNELSEPKNLHVFQALYFLSSFFGQWGPNATTWCGSQPDGCVACVACVRVAEGSRALQAVKDDGLVLVSTRPFLFSCVAPHGRTCDCCRLLPSELYPTEIRSTAHGISASCGKLGALFAGIYFQDLTSQNVRFLALS
jgi:hypothetical protein